MRLVATTLGVILLLSAKTFAQTEMRDSTKVRQAKETFERLKAFVWGEKNALSYAAMAEQLGMTEGAVKVAIHRLRQRYGELLRSEVAQTVSTPAEVNEELRYLVSVLRDGLANSGNIGPGKL